jgi:Mrp family chromosome partitioning ATPase
MTLMVRQKAAAGDRIGPRFLSLGDANRLVHMLRHERNTGTIAQLIAGATGEGTSSMARDLALAAARVAGVRVLLLDLTPPGNGQLAALRKEFDIAISATKPLIGPPAEVLVHQMDFGDLHVSEVFRSPAAGVSGWVGQFPALRTSFDLVLIDSQSTDESYDGIMLAPDVDTNLLVVEAEKTRSIVAQRLRDSIADVGGSIGGVVLNKRRFHVPEFIYRRV